MTGKNDALFLVRLPFGQKTIPYEDVPELIAMAKSPGYDCEKASEHEAVMFALGVRQEEDPLRAAVHAGEVEVLGKSLHRMAPPFNGMLKDTVLTVQALREYVESIKGFLEVEDALETQDKTPKTLRDSAEDVQLEEIKYYWVKFPRLQPYTKWRGGMIADTDVVTLDEAARFASKHAGTEITPSDFLRAAGRGQIPLRAIVHCGAKVKKHDGGIYCNSGTPTENFVPNGSIPTLPLTACEHLAAAGRASWRTFDGFEEVASEQMRYTKGQLIDCEPDFETTSADCRVTGNDVHALADAYIEAPAHNTITAAPVATANASGGVEPDKAGPLPLTTGDIAFCFAGLRWNEQQWKKPLGNKPKWLASCIAIPGARGVSETRWNPVLIGAALEREGHAKQNNIRARFQTVPQLAPWRDAWKTYEADNFDTQ